MIQAIQMSAKYGWDTRLVKELKPIWSKYTDPDENGNPDMLNEIAISGSSSKVLKQKFLSCIKSQQRTYKIEMSSHSGFYERAFHKFTGRLFITVDYKMLTQPSELKNQKLRIYTYTVDFSNIETVIGNYLKIKENISIPDLYNAEVLLQQNTLSTHLYANAESIHTTGQLLVDDTQIHKEIEFDSFLNLNFYPVNNFSVSVYL